MRVVVERVPRDVDGLLGPGGPENNGPAGGPFPSLMDAGLVFREAHFL